MIFEKANINDIPALVELRKAYLIEDYGELSEGKSALISENLYTYFQKHLNNDLIAFVCRDSGEIISCCFLCITEKPSNPTFINGRTGTVLNVYTKPEYRKKGLAGKLLRMLLDEAAKEELDFVELKATDSGYSLYKSIGFEDAPSKYHVMKYLIDQNNKF